MEITPRWVLQYWGTEVCRNNFHTDIWVASVENKLRQTTDNIVITDCRFSNEVLAIKNAGGITCRVERGPRPDWYDDAVNLNKGPRQIGWAIANVNLGVWGLTSDVLTLSQTPVQANAIGRLRWNTTDGTLDLGLKGGNVVLEVGQKEVARVVNKTTPLINLLKANYQVVKIVGATGQRLSVALAQANNDLNSASTLGVVTEDINGNQEGFIVTNGQIKQINTTGSLQGETWVDGEVLYLSPTIPGQLTKVKPIAPQHTVIVGFVEYSHPVNGKIFVKVDNGYELDELHNVRITSPTNGQVLTYDNVLSVWKNQNAGGLPSFLVGSVPFGNGTGLTENNTKFFWDNT